MLTGDLTDFGPGCRIRAPGGHARAPVNAAVPIARQPRRACAAEASFQSHTYLGDGEFVQYGVSLGELGLRLPALDTVEPGAPHGRLCTKRLKWLADSLDRHRGESVVIAMHHPPFETLIGHMDRIGLLEGADALAEILKGHPTVEGVICGHLHRPLDSPVGGAVASTAPSPAHQVCLDLKPDAKSAWILEPPGFHLHARNGPGRMVTHVAAVGRFDGPHPFHDGGTLID